MITSVTNAKIKHLSLLNQKVKARREFKEFVVEGTKMFLEAPPELVLEVYVSESFYKTCEYKEKIDQYSHEIISDEVFKKISDVVTPQGILCRLKQQEYKLNPILTKKAPLLVLLEDLQDPGNLGTIIRTGEGAGVDGIIMTKNTVDAYNPKVVRATMGSIYRVPFLYTDDIISLIHTLKNNNFTVFATHLCGSNYYDELSYLESSAILIGNEGNGLKKETADAASVYVKIPMEGEVESLNASIATTLMVYEANRQRRANLK